MTITIDTALTRCSNELQNTLARLTAASYSVGLRAFSDFLCEMGYITPNSPVTSLSMEDFIAFPAWLSSRQYSKRTIQVRNAAAKRFLEWLVVQGIIQPTYSETIRYETSCKAVNKKREDRLPQMAPRGAIDAIQQAAYHRTDPSPFYQRNLAIVEFFVSSGCRIAEVCALRVNDIDLKDCKAKVVGKGNKERIVFFSPEAASAISAYWKERGFADKHHPAFARHDDGAKKGKKFLPLSTVGMRQIVESIAADAGIENFHPHLFRHNFGTVMLRETGNLAMVQDLMGHASPASTRVYAKVDPGDLKQAHSRVWGRK